MAAGVVTSTPGPWGAVGAGTRAYREAGPYGITGHGPGGASFATGTATRYARQGGGGGAAPSGPWQPPPIPTSLYNPELDIRAAEGKTGSEQALSGDERQRTDAENNYGVSVANAERNHNETLANLAQSYQRLGARQGEGANASGTLYGGALIASAQRRAANEGTAKKANEAAYAEQRGRAALGEEQLLGPGGSLTEAAQNTRQSQQQFEQGIQTLKGIEAAKNGYKALTAPAAPKVNPLTGKTYTEGKEHGKTFHLYAGGRKVWL